MKQMKTHTDVVSRASHVWGRTGWLFVFMLLLSLSACSLIDEDLSDCGEEYEMNYELQLVTNISTELTTQLQTNINVSSMLRTHLSSIFSDKAHDVDLSFYNTKGDSLSLYHWSDTIDASQTSYTLYLPMRQYMHLAVANVVDNPVVHIESSDRCHTSMLTQVEGDTIDSHTTGLFTAREQMEVLEGVDQTFNVHLYMANCASTLLIDPRGYDYTDIQVYATGFATGFNICDSSYIFVDKAPIIRTMRMPVAGSGELCFTSVNFPSRDSDPTRVVIEGDEPFIAPNASEALWQFKVYVTLADGSITESVLNMIQPLRAGQLKVLKVHLADEQGVIDSDDNTVGVSVTLDWGKIDYPDIPL